MYNSLYNPLRVRERHAPRNDDLCSLLERMPATCAHHPIPMHWPNRCPFQTACVFEQAAELQRRCRLGEQSRRRSARKLLRGQAVGARPTNTCARNHTSLGYNGRGCFCFFCFQSGASRNQIGAYRSHTVSVKGVPSDRASTRVTATPPVKSNPPWADGVQ